MPEELKPEDAAEWLSGKQPKPASVNPKLIDCPDCKGKVSMNALTCPHCGAPFNGAPPGSKLTHCLDCGGRVSQNAITCPHCGSSMNTQKANPNMRFCSDCGNCVSYRALFCPKCGASFKRRRYAIPVIAVILAGLIGGWGGISYNAANTVFQQIIGLLWIQIAFMLAAGAVLLYGINQGDNK